MKKRQFIHTLQRYRQGNATEEERKFIESYYDLFETASGPDTWLKQEESEQVKKNILGEIWVKIQQRESGIGKGKVRKLFPPIVKVAAAALILLATGLMLHTMENHKKDNHQPTAENTEQRYKNDIKPGRNQAVLTLANGQRIILDSVQNGSLAQQGNTKIIKLNNGQLAYRGLQAGKSESEKVLYNTITTPRGGQYQIILPDGSKVWLNAVSSLHFPITFSGKKRIVEVSGEAYFEIAKQPENPFIVKAGDATVEVLGTHFNVNAYDNDKTIRTTLTEGSVRISERNESRVLKPGEQAGLDKETGNINIQHVNIDQALAWKNGMFYFDDTNIKAIMQEVARWYNVQVVYATKDIDKKDFSGVMSRYSNVEALLDRLELTGAVHFKIEGRQITVMN